MEEEKQEGQPVPPETEILTPPRFDVSGFQIVVVGNEIIIPCTNTKVGTVTGGPEGMAAVQSMPVVQLTMSPQTLKDLSIVTSERVADHEKEWGPIETTFTRKRQADAKTKA